jgi:hypothetical protein
MALGLGFGVQKPLRTGAFTIKSISGLAAWYKFNTLHTLDGNALEEWGDSSGNNRTLTNTGATNKRPTVESDGRIDWEDVSNSFMDIQNGPVPNTSAYTVIVVAEHDVASTFKISRYLNNPTTGSLTDTIAWGTLSGSTNQIWQAIVNGFADSSSRFSQSLSSGQIQDDTKTILIYRYGGGSTAGDQSLKIQHIADGASSITTVTTVNLSNSSDAVLAGVAVGFDSSTQYIRGYMDEMCVWSRKIDDTELDQVIADLKARHNMT